jgi:hypothetical protein
VAHGKGAPPQPGIRRHRGLNIAVLWPDLDKLAATDTEAVHILGVEAGRIVGALSLQLGIVPPRGVKKSLARRVMSNRGNSSVGSGASPRRANTSSSLSIMDGSPMVMRASQSTCLGGAPLPRQ